MLPKIAAAISQWIQPIKTRQTSTEGGEGGGGNAYQKFSKNKEGEPQEAQKAATPPPVEPISPIKQGPHVRPVLKVVPNSTLDQPKGRNVENDAVFSFLRVSNDSPIHKWFGVKDYQQGSKRQKKAARAKKGALVDKKI